MDKEVFFSVIIPVYNTEKYLSRCIESVLKQTYKNFELLLIDDGSPDNCGVICDYYANLDERIKVFHKPNGGVSSARNLGLDNAKGDYICFIDSDDYVDERYLEIHLPKYGEDLVQSSVNILVNEYLKEVMSHDDIFNDYNRFWMQSRQGWIVNSCISKKLIDDLKLRFSIHLKMGEDSLFNHIVISKCNKVRRTKESLYHYNVDNLYSASHKYYEDRLDQQLNLMKELKKYFKDEQIYRICWDYWHEVLNHYKVKGISHKDNKIRLNAKRKTKQTYNDMVFRKCIPYMRIKGSLDEKIETYFMNYYLHWMIKYIINGLQFVSSIKIKNK